MSYQRRTGTSFRRGTPIAAFKDGEVSGYINHLRDVASNFRKGARGQHDTFHEFVVDELVPKQMLKDPQAQALLPQMKGNTEAAKQARVQYMAIFRNKMNAISNSILQNYWRHSQYPVCTTASDAMKTSKIAAKHPNNVPEQLKALKAAMGKTIARWWMLNKSVLKPMLASQY